MAKKKRDNRPGQRRGNQHPTKANSTSPLTTQANSPAESESQAQTKQASGNKKEEEADIGRRVSKHVLLDSIFTFVIASAAVIQGVVSYRQWEVMDRSLSQTDTVIAQMRLEQRPWVKVRVAKFHDAEPNDHARAELDFINVGNTPAFVRSYRAAVLVAPGPRTEQDATLNALLDNALSEFSDNTDGDPYEILAPNDKSIVWTMSPEHFTKGELEGLEMGRLEIYTIGRVVYADVAGNEYSTAFCFFPDGAGSSAQYRDYNSMK